MLRYLMLVVLTVLFMATGIWFLTGGRIFSVQTGSMRPRIQPGDAVLIRPAKKPVVGDVISFNDYRQANMVVTHRIVAQNKAAALLTTRGDNNGSADPSITEAAVLGKVQYVAPHLGWWLNRLRQPLGLALAVYLPACVGVVLIVRAAYRQPVYYGR